MLFRIRSPIIPFFCPQTFYTHAQGPEVQAGGWAHQGGVGALEGV
jgi:hypothetical protein